MTIRTDDIAALEASELFDGDWYLTTYRDVAHLRMSPEEHYLRIGARLGRDPSRAFSTIFYSTHYEDVARSGVNPLLHYLAHGCAEGRKIARPDEAGLAEPPATTGTEDLEPAELARVVGAFDAGFYLDANPDVREAGIDPFIHFMTRGWRELRDPSSRFSTRYYLEHSPDVRDAGINPFVHYVLHGAGEKRAAIPFRLRLMDGAFEPKVSVIIPNYNHGRYLEQRIESVLRQTYRNFDLLLLDDCSSDDSREVISRYCASHPDRVSSLLNESNSGNVFRQWRKGVESVDGDLVWICESDDFCEPDFLERLVPLFRDRSVNIGFGRIQFADAEGRFQEGLDAYREGAEPGIWTDTLVRPASQWFANGFGVNNVIANVGGCVWRRQAIPGNVWREAETYSILGDWFLYCHVAGGGQIAYEPAAIAYFRQHGANTSVRSFVSPPYYREHQRLMLLLRERWGVPAATVERFFGKVAFQYRHFGLDESLGSLQQYLDLDVLLAQDRCQAHVLIAFLGFHPGGGEVFPINLANALHEQGVLVSMLALDMAEVNSDMMAALDPAIAVYDASYVEEAGADAFLANAGVSLIHSHMASLEWFLLEKCAMETHIPYLVTLHGSYEASRISEERLSRFVARVSHWVYTADKNLEPFRGLEIPKGATSKLGNGMPIDPRPFPKTRSELGIDEDAVVFTLVARGIQRKGWRAAITAFLQLRASAPGQKLHLLLCGNGPAVDAYAQAHGDDPDITFLGYQSRIHGLYRLSDVAIVPTRFAGESFPLCIIQAMQAGTPVIATRIGEIAAMLAPEGRPAAGLLIENSRDTGRFTADLQEAMSRMLDPSLRARLGHGALENSELYSMERTADRYRAIYQALLAPAGSNEANASPP